jgi:hypothetical protein
MIKPNRTLRALLSVTTIIGFTAPAYAQNVITPTPPARVGDVAAVSGSVSFYGAGSNAAWVAATPNYPVTAGDALFTQDGAEAAIAIGASRLTMGPNTELQVTALDDNDFTATESQGEVFLNLTDLEPGQTFSINTPRGAVTLQSNGAYDINAGDATTPTTVAVISGSATLGSLQIIAGQEGNVTSQGGELVPLAHDAFMDHVLAELAPPPPPYAPPVVEQMTGAAVLSSYGTWSQSPDYGAVWYPEVDAGWAPYREGHWAFIAPWGWTWVDVEPWGFAPFHYGRWIHDGGRWGWVPAADYAAGASYQPVYAPAVVGFFGLAAGVAITAALLAHGSVGWVPLAPGEAYYPTYHASPAYIRQINIINTRHFDPDGPRPDFAHYADRGAATYIPADAMARGAAVSHYGHPVPAEMFSQARPVEGAAFNQAVRPNMTPRPAAAPHPSAFADHPAALAPSRPGEEPGITRPPAPGLHVQGAMVRPPEVTAPRPVPTARPEPIAPHMPAPVDNEALPRVYEPHLPVEAAHPQEPARLEAPPAPFHPEMQARPEMPARLEAPARPEPRPEAARPAAHAAPGGIRQPNQ